MISDFAARRARRDARRAQQRLQSLERARAMHAVRLQYLHDEPADHRLIAESRAEWIGCSGWYYWHWRGGFYPAGAESSCWFPYYARRFRTVELNAPFYSWPTLQTVQRWRRAAARKRFVYSVKVNSVITHERRFARTRQLVQDFYHIANLLGPHMACFLFQLPPSVHYSRRMLDRILHQLDPRQRNVVEFRHRSWWREEVYRAFRDANAIFCSCSGPRLPDELVKTHDEIYLRFHGTKQWYRHDYSKQELEIWAQRIRNSGAARVWIYFNNDRDCHAIKNARMLMRLLKLARSAPDPPPLPANGGVGNRIRHGAVGSERPTGF